MHAVIGSFAMDRARLELQRRELEAVIMPMVKELPGFLQGYWSYEPGDSQAYSYIAFETEAQAQRLLEVVRANAVHQAGSGVAVGWLKIVEVWGQARGGQTGT